MRDGQQRKIEYARISLTDRCNLNCSYCRPHNLNRAYARELSEIEILRAAKALVTAGIRKLRLTGGEPLLYKGIQSLIFRLKEIDGIEEIGITTNGILLEPLAASLAKAGLTHINISLDAMHPETYSCITGSDNGLDRVLKGLAASLDSGINNIRLNCVPLKGINENEVAELAQLARDNDISVRYIRLMPIGSIIASDLKGIGMDEVKKMLSDIFGDMERVPSGDELSGPAEYYRLQGFRGKIGFIDSLDHSFCSSCNRIRLTSDGILKPCLSYSDGIDIKELLARDDSGDELVKSINEAIWMKPASHCFMDKIHEKRETRNMFQIGG